METSLKTEFTFNELSPKAKDNFRHEWAQIIGVDRDWHTYIIDDAIVQGRAKGFYIDELNYTGFYSQGDGASWTGYVDMIHILDKLIDDPNNAAHHRYGVWVVLKELMHDHWITHRMYIGRRSFRYLHAHTMEIDEERPTYASAVFQDPDENDLVQTGVLQGAQVKLLMDEMQLESVLQDLEDYALEEAKRFADDVYIALRREWEYQLSDEHLAELCECNYWMFNEEGERHGI